MVIDDKNDMTEQDIKFKLLLSEMEDLMLHKVPAVKNSIVALENRERHYDEDTYEERQRKETELSILRDVYVQIKNDLKEIDEQQTMLELKNMIKGMRALNTSHYLRLLHSSPQAQIEYGPPRVTGRIIYTPPDLPES